MRGPLGCAPIHRRAPPRGGGGGGGGGGDLRWMAVPSFLSRRALGYTPRRRQWKHSAVVAGALASTALKGPGRRCSPAA